LVNAIYIYISRRCTTSRNGEYLPFGEYAKPKGLVSDSIVATGFR